jgi:dTDP-4-amino-4,6-dideoxygalactose transaminase
LKFENEFSKYTGNKFAIGISQARLGLITCLRSLGFNKGDEIILSSYNFHIIPECLIGLGLVPVFVDIESETYNINPKLIKEKITNRTKAIIATHMFGQPVDMEGILEIAKEYKIKVIEDCAHALGAEYSGKKVGSMGDVGIFSFGLGKNMPCFGGGMITTNDVHLFEKLKSYISHSKFPSQAAILMSILKHSLVYLATTTPVFTFFTFPAIRIFNIFGIDLKEFEKKESLASTSISNYGNLALKLTNIQAAVGLEQLKKVEYFNNRRIENSILFSKNLSSFNSIKFTKVIPNSKPIYLYYKIRIKNKVFFRKQLFAKGIDTSKKSEMSDCSALSSFAKFKNECPISESINTDISEIPNNHFLSVEDINIISECVKKILGAHYS